MSNIFEGQTALKIKLTCNQDISGALTKEIRARKPDGTLVNFTALVSNATIGIIYYDLTTSAVIALDQPGLWTFWSYIQFADGREGYGDAVEQLVFAEGLMGV